MGIGAVRARFGCQQGPGSGRTEAALASAVLGLLVLLAACGACPPAWLEHPPARSGWLYATGSCGEVYVEAEARDVALTRAARRLADTLGVDTEGRLAVTWADGRVFVELILEAGPSDALDAMELVDRVRCDGVTHVLVRLPRS